MVEVCVHVAYVLTAALTFVTSLAAPNDFKTKKAHESLVKHLDTVGSHLETLSRSIRSAHADIASRQIEECEIMGPVSDTTCALLLLDDRLGDNYESSESIDEAVSNTFVPEKRSGLYPEATQQRKVLLQDLLQKQRMLQRLRSVIDNAKQELLKERKRSCNLNLGFHCQTEQYSRIADMYNWLQSSLSPGKRRK